MDTTIEAEVILANLFKNSNRQTVQIRDLNRLREILEVKFRGIYVDVTKNSLIRAVNRNTDRFGWEENLISRLGGPWTDDFADSLDWRIPADIRSEVTGTIADYRTFSERQENKEEHKCS